MAILSGGIEGKVVASVASTPLVNLAVLAPVANFVVDPESLLSGPRPLQVSFHDQSTGSPWAWNWTISDGVHTLTATVLHPTFELNNIGVYSVTLTVQNSYSMSSPFTRIDYVTVT